MVLAQSASVAQVVWFITTISKFQEHSLAYYRDGTQRCEEGHGRRVGWRIESARQEPWYRELKGDLVPMSWKYSFETSKGKMSEAIDVLAGDREREE